VRGLKRDALPLHACQTLVEHIRASALSAIIASQDWPAEPLYQLGANTTLSDPSCQFVTANPKRAGNRLSKTLATTLDKSVISQVRSDGFQPQSMGTKGIQVPCSSQRRQRGPAVLRCGGPDRGHRS
jgi:hypothetical protein